MPTPARFEFRTFAWHFGPPVTRLRRLGSPGTIEERRESYLMAPAVRDLNVKLRGNESLDIKDRVERHRGLERWQPRQGRELPLTGTVVAGELFPALELPPPVQPRTHYDHRALRAALAQCPGAVVVEVLKRRHRFTLDDLNLKAEYARVWFNGAGLTTLAVEGEDPEAVLEGVRALALDAHDNVSYPQALRFVLGLDPLPDDWLETL